MAAIGAVYAATHVTLPRFPCTLPTAAFLHRWNTAAGHVHSDVSLATYLAIAGGVVAALGMLIARHGARVFVCLACIASY